LREWIRKPIVLVGLGLVLVGVVGFFATAQATDAPSFCATCHEMQPYVTAWHVGQHHKSVGCVECHVDTGVARYTHKFVALIEVWDHFTKRPAFPMSPPFSVPDYRCQRCHPVQKQLPKSRFSHTTHKAVPCYKCHADTGHRVTSAALAAAGVLAAGTGPTPAEAVIPVSAAGHKMVSCVQCHNLAVTPCSLCHQAPHGALGPCDRCHKPGGGWVFSHPPAGDHSYLSFPCVKCHPHGYQTASCTCHGGKPPTGGD
jgi:hypothetical protein